MLSITKFMLKIHAWLKEFEVLVQIGTLLYVRVVKANNTMNPELSCMDGILSFTLILVYHGHLGLRTTDSRHSIACMFNSLVSVNRDRESC